jgi:hypothetical protein
VFKERKVLRDHLDPKDPRDLKVMMVDHIILDRLVYRVQQV